MNGNRVHLTPLSRKSDCKQLVKVARYFLLHRFCLQLVPSTKSTAWLLIIGCADSYLSYCLKLNNNSGDSAVHLWCWTSCSLHRRWTVKLHHLVIQGWINDFCVVVRRSICPSVSFSMFATSTLPTIGLPTFYVSFLSGYRRRPGTCSTIVPIFERPTRPSLLSIWCDCRSGSYESVNG